MATTGVTAATQPTAAVTAGAAQIAKVNLYISMSVYVPSHGIYIDSFKV